MPRPVCVPCGQEMFCSANGRLVHITQDGGRPYQVWSGDEFECRGCGHRTVVGFGRAPVAEHFQNGFDRWMGRSEVVVR